MTTDEAKAFYKEWHELSEADRAAAIQNDIVALSGRTQELIPRTQRTLPEGTRGAFHRQRGGKRIA
jgi:hypothetical protein